MKPSTLETWIWSLIYGGLIAVCLGIFVARQNDVLGTVLGVAGGVVAVVGFALIYVRSRLGDSGQSKAKP